MSKSKEMPKDSMSKRHNQKIGCSVDSCKYHDEEEQNCTLSEINVSCNDDCSKTKVTCKEETICDSFEKKCDAKEQVTTEEEDA